MALEARGLRQGLPSRSSLGMQASEGWLGGRDSNPDNVLQRHASYRWTTSQSGYSEAGLLRRRSPLPTQRRRGNPDYTGTNRSPASSSQTQNLPMNRNPSFLSSLCLALVLFLVALAPGMAAAQSKAFLTGTAFAEIKQFDTIAYDPRVLATNADNASLDATGAGGGIRIGTFLHPRWSLEFAVDAGSTTKEVFPDPYGSIRPAIRVAEVSASTRFLSVATVVGFHPEKIGRVRLGYLGGFSFVRATHESELPDFAILLGSQVVWTGGSFGSTSTSSGGLAPSIFPPPVITTRTIRQVDNSPGAVLGLEASIDVTGKLAVVPEIRALTFSSAGRTVFLIRPGAGVRWSF